MAEQEENQAESAIIYPPDWHEKNSIIDQEEELRDEKDFDNQTKKEYFAFGMGAAVELSLGFGGTALWAAKNISTLKKARMLTTAAGVAGPQALEPFSTVGSALSFFGTSAAIWGLSNVAGQSTRNALLNNNEYSAGEIMAASLFGGLAGPTSKFGLSVTSKLTSAGGKFKDGARAITSKIKVGGSTFADLGIYKSSVRVVEVAGKQGTRMVGGSSFAVAETALRQELQLILDERDSRDATEYMLAAGLGGVMNVGTRGAMDLVQTKWGRQLHKRAVGRTQVKLDKEIKALEKSIAKDKKKIKPDSNSRSNLMRKDVLATKQIKLKEMADAKYVLDDYSLKLELHSTKAAAAVNPEKSWGDEGPPVEELDLKPGKPKKDFDKDVDDIIKKKNDLTRESGKLAEEFEAQGVSKTEAGKANPLELQKPQIRQDAKKIKKELNDEADVIIQRFSNKVSKGGKGKDEAAALLKNIQIRSKLNTKLLDDLDQEWAQSGLASQRRYSLSNWFGNAVERTSARAKAENEGLEIAAKALKGYIKDAGKFEELSKIFKGDISEGGVLSASKIAKDNVKRIDDKINKLTEQEKYKAKEKGEKFKDTKEIEDLKNLKDTQEKAVETEAKSLDKTKTKIDDKLGIKLEEYNKLTKAEKTAHLNKRAEELGVKPKKIRSELTALKNKAKSKANRLAKKEITDEQTEFYENIGRAFQKEMDASVLGKTKSGLKGLLSYRKLAMINQLRTVVLGPVSASTAVATRGLAKPWARFIAGFHPNAPKSLIRDRWEILINDHTSTFKAVFKNMGETFKSAKTSFKNIRSETLTGENTSATYLDANRGGNIPSGPARSIIKQGQNAAKVVAAQNNLLKHMSGKTTGVVKGGIQGVSTIGLRSIVAGDDVFFRILLRQASSQEALVRATQEFATYKGKDRRVKIRQKAKEIEDSYWELNEDGVRVFKTTEENVEWANGIREEMFWGAYSDDFATKVYEPSVDRLLAGLTRAEQKSVAVETLRNVPVPFLSVALRTSSLSTKNQFSPFRILSGRTTFRNPYNKGIKDLKAQERVIDTRLDEGFVFGKEGQKVTLTKAQIDEMHKSRVILSERIDTLKARSVDFNVKEYTRMLSTLGFGYAAWELADAGALTGSMGWMTDKQRFNQMQAGFKPHTVMIDGKPVAYRQFAPYAQISALMGDVQRWREMKENDKLEEGQDIISVVFASLKATAMDNPLFQGIQDIGRATNLENRNAARYWWEKAVGSFVPVPAEIKNWNKLLNGDGQISDLRGGSYADRMLYHTLGRPMSEKQFDFYGNPKKSTKNFASQLGRVFPEDETELTPLTKLAVNDTSGVLVTEFAGSDNFIYGEKLSDWVDEEGYTLRTEFAKRLSETTEMQFEINNTIQTLNSINAFNKMGEKNADGLEIKGLAAYEKINKLRADAYRKVKDSFESDIILNKGFLNKYIRANTFVGEEEFLGDVLGEKAEKASGIIWSNDRTMLEILEIEDK